MNYYKVRVKFLTVDDKGQQKVTIDDHLFTGVNYADAEKRAYIEFADNSTEFAVDKVTKVKYSDIYELDIPADAVFFKAKVQYIVFDERNQKDKKVPFYFLVEALSIVHALQVLAVKLGTVQDYVITDLNMTSILSVNLLQLEATEEE